MEKVKNETQTKRELVITRIINAPRELVFKAFTESERLAQWWGPKGSEIKVSKLELRPGGTFLYNMSRPDGLLLWGKFVYREIIAPERIVFINSFSDENGNIIRAPFSETFPLEVMNTLTLTEENGKTTLTLRGLPINATDEENETFFAMTEGMQQGFKGTFDQLEEYLNKIQSK